MNINFNAQGCFALILVLFLLTFLFKFWFLIILGIIIVLIFSKLKNILKIDPQKEVSFNNQPGKVYKQCIYCDTKAERSAKICKSCGRSFE